MKTWMMSGSVALCMALSLTACSEEDLTQHGVAPSAIGEISVTPSEDIRPGEQVTASIVLPTDGENIAQTTYAWNGIYPGEERDGMSYYTFNAADEPGSHTLTFSARYLFSAPDVEGNVYKDLQTEQTYQVVTCDIFSSKWGDNVERTCEIYQGLTNSEDNPNAYEGQFVDVLGMSSTSMVARTFIFGDSGLSEIREALSMSTSAPATYSRRYALMRRMAQNGLGMSAVREYYVAVDAPDTQVSFDADAEDDSWMADLGAKVSAGTHRVYAEFRSTSTQLLISMSPEQEGTDGVLYERVYTPVQ